MIDEEIKKYIDCCSLSVYQDFMRDGILYDPYLILDDQGDWYYKTVVKDETPSSMLEFGCGDGRWLSYFKQYCNTHCTRFDGCDISQECVDKTLNRIKNENIPGNAYKVIYDRLDSVPDDTYDLIYSITVFWHIPIYTLRMRYLAQLLNKLKDGGRIAIQMGAGKIHFKMPESGRYADYKEDATWARWSNSRFDVQVLDYNLVIEDLQNLGYSNVTATEMDQPGYKQYEMRCWMHHKKQILIEGYK